MNCIYDNMSINIEDIRVDFTCVNNEERDYNYDGTPHLHAMTEVILTPEEGCVIYTDNKIFKVKSGSICIVPSGCIHTVEPRTAKGKTISFFIGISKNVKKGTLAEKCYDNICRLAGDIVVIEECSEVISRFMRFKKNEKNYNSIMTDFFEEIIKKISVTAKKQNINENKKCIFREEDFILEYYIMENYIRKFSINNVAEFVGYSPTYTARKIKQNYGMTYSKLVMRLKMSFARKLLIMTDKPFYEIAIDVGYDSYNGFGLAFKKFFKKTPEQMRTDEEKTI